MNLLESGRESTATLGVQGQGRPGRVDTEVCIHYIFYEELAYV